MTEPPQCPEPHCYFYKEWLKKSKPSPPDPLTDVLKWVEENDIDTNCKCAYYTISVKDFRDFIQSLRRERCDG